MKRYESIIVTGSMSWDTIMDFPNKFVDYLHPEKLHQINISFVVDGLEKQIGGTGTDIAYGASETKKILSMSSSGLTRRLKDSRLRGNDKHVGICLLGGLGKDGKDHLAFFRKNGIDTRGIIVDQKKYSASGSVITDIKDNQIWGFYYGACEAGKKVNFKKHVKKNSLMIVSANHPQALLAAQNYAIKNKVDYMCDVGMALSWISDKDLKNGVMNAKFLIGNDYEIAMIIKRLKVTVSELVKKGIGVITTLGDNGVRLNFATDSAAHVFPPVLVHAARVSGSLHSRHLLQNFIKIPAVKIKKVVDPTGAGDAWRGGFMTAYSEGYGIIDCLKIGNVVASFSIEHYGTVNYKIGKSEFNKRLKSLDV